MDNDFKDIYKVNADDVMKRQISMIHKKSGIQCIVAFEKDDRCIQSTKIIDRFATEPLCKQFIVQK